MNNQQIMAIRSRLSPWTIVAVLAAAACGTPKAAPAAATSTDVVVADADAATGELPTAEDSAPDGQTGDIAHPDAVLDGGIDAAPDVPAADVAPDQTDTAGPVDASCAQLGQQIDMAKAKITACKPDQGCEVFEYPICGSAGCFQTPFAKDADVSELASWVNQASAAQCKGFNCGCNPPTPAFCLKGECRQCPPDCDGTCDELKATLLTIAHAANWCSTDADCTVVNTALCPVGDLPCGGILVNKWAKPDSLDAVLQAYGAACGPSTCKCKPPEPGSCIQGKCTLL